ncbi:hypothetical protein DFH07DRAFT_22032 [Mycena maculata]|uniref:Galactose oxidase n=1 Tax=Mycena maculata TaxID=230809 RepID=A0AAD7N3W3_9AGAR|nr:hypothetical protein DFH07DRAFT_22032 [Mycena maculata]
MAKGQISLLLVTVFCFSLYVDAALSVDPVPPLQWLRLDTLLKGSTSPGGLKDASMGYSEERRTLIIFGGEASSTVPQGQTYLLNLESLTWSTPSPPVTLQQTPPARSAAVSGVDSAASNRDGFIVLGGKGADGAALSDVWEFDFTNQFWAEVTISPGGPSARWGSSGGIDTRVPPVSDPVLPGPNNTLWLWGGENGQSSFSDLWRLNISGTLSSNMPNSAVGSWEHLPLANLPETVGQGGGVSGDQIVFSGGCNTTSFSGDACALQDTYIINAGANGATESAALKCPAPRLSPTVVPNGNVVSVTFSNQMFLLLGTFNTSLWNDSGGLEAGEVVSYILPKVTIISAAVFQAVLDTNSQSWTRIIPSGDPGTSGTPSFPSPRDGAVAVMSPLSLVGQSRTSSSDIIVFGGRDMDGNYLSELWLLRAYNGSVTPTDPKWSGFGNGQLQTGVDANGAGVENTFISSCASASAIAGSGIPTSSSSSSKSTSTSTSSSGSDSGSSGDNDGTPSTSLLNTSLVHKLSAPLSVALLMPSFLLFRLTSPSFNSSQSGAWPHAWYYASALLGLAGYALGIAGIATSFTTISSIDASRPPPLSTVHGRAGLALFISLYGLVPVVAILLASTRHVLASATAETRKRADSDLTEKDRLPRSIHSPSPPASTRRRTHSWGPSSWRKVREDSLSIDSGSAEMGDSFNSAPGQRGFEVLNRPARTRRASGSRLGVPLTHMSQHAGSHSLGDLDWLNRRRSLTAVGELDLNQTTAAVPPPSTPGTLLEPPAAAPPPNMPPPSSVLLRLFFHASLLGLCVFCLVALWFKAPRSTFGVFLAWTVAFYVILLSSGWRGKPDRSTLSLLLDRLRTAPPAIAPRPSVSDTLPETDENVTFPYIHHRPTYRRALLSDATGPQGTDTEEEDDDRAEDEMRRRDISIVTSYPKRQLRITNPS